MSSGDNDSVPVQGQAGGNATGGAGAAGGRSGAASGPSGRPSSLPSVPNISLPKGGGAIRGIGEKFSVNLCTGTASISFPVLTTLAARQNMQPDLSLSYDSGGGNGIFGLGWHLSGSTGAIMRKTARGLPVYQDAVDSDVFLLEGAEDLVPVSNRDASGKLTLDSSGFPVPEEREVNGFMVRQYSPRITQDFSRVERWTSLTNTSDIHWRTLSPRNETTIYGANSQSRIYNARVDQFDDEPLHIFSWLVSERYDAYGNAMIFTYKAEDAVNVDMSSAHEANRDDWARMSNRHIKSIRYGNTTPNRHAQSWLPTAAHDLSNETWKYSVVFDYGEHDLSNPKADDLGQWLCRVDPYSSYHAGFEVRTYRLCRRVLMFHHFQEELGLKDYLVSSTDVTYKKEPAGTYLVSAKHVGFVLNQDGVSYSQEIMPPVEFGYSLFPSDEELSTLSARAVDQSSLEGNPVGIDDRFYRWVDLDGEGSSGILSEQGNCWYYKRNTSATNYTPSSVSPDDGSVDNAGGGVSARFSGTEMVPSRPSSSIQTTISHFGDVEGGGKLDLIVTSDQIWGYYERTPEKNTWKPFRAFPNHPNLDTASPNIQHVDLTGDGLPDILDMSNQNLRWYQSLSTAGFGPGKNVPGAAKEEMGPLLMAGGKNQIIYLADMSGDGLADIVRIRNSDVCYWPSLGYGRWGRRVQMSGAPCIDYSDAFNEKRIRLADIDGSGTTDLIYFGTEGVDIYRNQSGNGFAPRKRLSLCPASNQLDSIHCIDLLGNGTTCLVWSSPLPQAARASMHYLDLTKGRKPHLLTSVVNNFGSETKLHYVSSTRFYLEDKQAGNPWLTRLPFPVHCVQKVETVDHVSRNRFVKRYSYHHGYFDSVEREFRGFARCEQWDTDHFAEMNGFDATNIDESWHAPPVHTKTWFHTGAYVNSDNLSQYLAHEYFGAPKESSSNQDRDRFYATLLPDAVPLPDPLATEAIRETCRALKNQMLRTELYADDGSDKSHIPYSVEEANYTVEAVQPVQDKHQHSIFSVHPRETLRYAYERNLDDPKVDHSMTLQVDAFGNILRQVKIAYGRQSVDSSLDDSDQTRQRATWISYSQHDFTVMLSTDTDYRTPVNYHSREYELRGVEPRDGRKRFSMSDFTSDNFRPIDDLPNIRFEEPDQPNQVGKRMFARFKLVYRGDDLISLLPAGEIQALALPGQEYDLCFTPGLLANVYKASGAAQRSLNPFIPNAGNMLGSTGGYVDVDGDGHWWIPSSRVFLHPDASATPAAELQWARLSFFQPQLFVSPFGGKTVVTYDDHKFLAIGTVDPVGNTHSSLPDYRVVAARVVTDQNGNKSAAHFGPLGMVTATAVIGKENENSGDSVDNLPSHMSQQELDTYLSNPRSAAPTLLGTATTRILYDTTRYWLDPNPNPQDKVPAFVASISRETHTKDLAHGALSKVQQNIAYCDGFGRVIQTKAQSRSGLVTDDGADVADRWLCSGWTIYNNKGKPVRKYEPFYDNTPRYKFATLIGVSPITMYDPLMRVVATLRPDHSFEKFVFGPWRQTRYDACDNVSLRDPTQDEDVGGYFQLLPEQDYRPSWYDARINSQLGPNEKVAAERTATLANTPIVAHLDALGHTIVAVEELGGSHISITRAIYDISGNVLESQDPLGHVTMRYDYSMTGQQIHSSSMDAGERWLLHDAGGKSIFTWNSRTIRCRFVYDLNRRMTELWVREGAAGEVLGQKMMYGEEIQDSETKNLRGALYTCMDQAGKMVSEQYDFKGNLQSSSRMLAVDYRNLINWSGSVRLETQSYGSSTTYDAMNRRVRSTSDDSSITFYSYDEGGLLSKMFINIHSELPVDGDPFSWTPVLADVTHNARGQIQNISYGNSTTGTRTYDDKTFRLRRVQTLRPRSTGGVELVQDLEYTYDPLGNVIRTKDNAQSTIYFRNSRIEPTRDYTYDAKYRLIKASGREHLGQTDGAPNAPTPPSPLKDDTQNSPTDGNAMGAYTEQYDYDLAGNIQSVVHMGTDPRHPGWTRSYVYNEASLHAGGRTVTGNRLSSTSIGGVGSPPSEHYTYEGLSGEFGGLMTSMSHLKHMEWDAWDRLRATSTQTVTVPGAVPATTYYVYDSAGHRVRKVTDSEGGTAGGPATPTRIKERIYLGDGLEVFRRYKGDGETPSLERSTVRVSGPGGSGGSGAIVLIETRTKGTPADDDDIIAERMLRFQLDDLLGSVAVELDEAAQLVTYEEHFPYGCSSYRSVAGARRAPKRYRYSGKELDDETRLYFYGARYYAAWLGRWVSPEPEGHDGHNLYMFVRGNPVSNKDDDGRSSVMPHETPVAPRAPPQFLEPLPLPPRSLIAPPMPPVAPPIPPPVPPPPVAPPLPPTIPVLPEPFIPPVEPLPPVPVPRKANFLFP
ncbi:SpvB domain-containing protein [Fusarium oxysporum]|nr:SpvB domain-containing protein [Fusarium oxysporum]